jgi:hypothetical protein
MEEWTETLRKKLMEKEPPAKLICTPFAGRFGPAGWIVVVNGTPPRGRVLFCRHIDGSCARS